MKRVPFLTLFIGASLTFAMLVASCGDSGTEVATDQSTTTVVEATSTTTAPTTATSAPTTTASTPPADDATDDPRCDDPGAQAGDVDGDGADDLVVHLFAGSDAVLRLCASSVGYQEIPGLGQAQHLDLADIEQDGRVEVFYGATGAGYLGAQVAVVVDGTLTPVSFEGESEPLVLYDGYPDGFEAARHDFGCAPGADGGRALFVKEYDFAAGIFDTSELAIEGGVASVVSTGPGQAEFAETPSSAPPAAEDLIDPC